MSRDLFKFQTRGHWQHVGSTVRRHVSHGFESQRLSLGRNQKHKFMQGGLLYHLYC